MKRKYIKLLVFIIMILILGIFNKEENQQENNTDLNTKFETYLKINFIDIGQGDSIFIELPNNETMLIDAGENGKEVVDYINNLGYKKINYLIATHPHSDHIGGMEEVIDNFEIEKIYMPKVIHNIKTYEDLLLKIDKNNLKINKGTSGVNILNHENLSVDIVAPNNDNYKEINNYSIVILLKYGNNKFLFMGDAEKLSENEINSNIQADVLKVGHHGSDTSSSTNFIQKVNPKYSIISVGKDNIYNLPTNTVINRFKKLNTKIYRTDLNGNIVVTSNGDEINIDLEKGEL